VRTVSMRNHPLPRPLVLQEEPLSKFHAKSYNTVTPYNLERGGVFYDQRFNEQRHFQHSLKQRGTVHQPRSHASDLHAGNPAAPGKGNR